MNRPYYTLSAMLAAAVGSTLAVQPARCQSAPLSYSAPSRTMLASEATRQKFQFVQFDGCPGANISVCPAMSDVPAYPYSCGYDPDQGEIYDANESLRDFVNRDVVKEVEYWKIYNSQVESSTWVDSAGTCPTETAIKNLEARINNAFVDFENGVPTQCGGDTQCSNLDRSDMQSDDSLAYYEVANEVEVAEGSFDYWTVYSNDFSYWTAYRNDFNYWIAYSNDFKYWIAYADSFEYWTAYQNEANAVNQVVVNYDYSATSGTDWDCNVCYPSFREDTATAEVATVSTPTAIEASEYDYSDLSPVWNRNEDAWKTCPAEMPNWLEEYASGRSAKPAYVEINHDLASAYADVESAYAEAELQASLEASDVVELSDEPSELDSAAYEVPSPNHVTYADEYESLYGLDTMLVAEGDDVVSNDMEADDTDSTEFSPVCDLIGRLLSPIAQLFGSMETADIEVGEMLESADGFIDEVEEASIRTANSIQLAQSNDAYADYLAMAEYDRLMIDSLRTCLPVETLESRNALESVSQSLRFAAQLLTFVADNVEAETLRVLSARSASPLAR